jgi:catecholate siderophore receptor
MRYTPGVTQRQNSPDGAIIRGLAASALNHYEDGYLAPPLYADMGEIDRIEVIKGPSASIAGASESTGFINYITKQPEFVDRQTLALTFGSWNFFHGVLDVTGPMPGFDQLAYRLVATYVNSNTFRDNERINKTAIYPSFLWKISPSTTLHIRIDSVDNTTPGGYETFYIAPTLGATATLIPVPSNAKIQENRFGPLNVNTSEPGMYRTDTESALFAAITHQFNSYLNVRQSLDIYTYTDSRFYNALSDNMSYDANGNLNGTFQTDKYSNSNEALRMQGDLAFADKWFSDDLSVRALVGYELVRTRNTAQTFLSPVTAAPINLLQPDYTQDVANNLNLTVLSATHGGSFAEFGNAQIGFLNDRIILTGGLRRDQNKATWTLNELNNGVTNLPTTPVITSPLGGLTIKPVKWFSLFGVYSKAGSAASTVSTFPGIPTTDPRQTLVTITPDTKNHEFGGKFTFFDSNLSVDISHFDTTQDNIVRGQTDPSVPGGSENFVDSGNRTHGIEVDIAGNLTKKLSIFGGYVNDRTSAPGNKPNAGGQLELRGTPRDKVSVFLRYDLFKTMVSDFSVKAGIVHQTAVYGRASDTYIIPGSTRADAGVDLLRGHWAFSTGIANITNVVFPAFAVGQGSNTIDDPRNYYLSASYKF